MKDDPGSPVQGPFGRRDVGPGRGRLEHAPDLSGGPVAENRAIGERESSGHQAAVAANVRVANGVDAEVEWVQTSREDAFLDRSTIEAERNQLPPGDDPELPGGNPGDNYVNWALSFIHVMNKGAHPTSRPPGSRNFRSVGAFV